MSKVIFHENFLTSHTIFKNSYIVFIYLLIVLLDFYLLVD